MKTTRLQYLRKHWTTYLWQIVKTFVAWFSVLMTSVLTMRNILQLSEMHHAEAVLQAAIESGWLVPAIALGVLVVACIVRFPTIRCSYRDPRTNIHVIIECCDLLQQDGLKVIHSVDTFDTALGSIITPRSLHGAFLALCKRKKIDVDTPLKEQLRRMPKEAHDEKLPGRKDRYALGSICPLPLGGEDYAMVSFAHMQQDGSIRITHQEYVEFLHKMWEGLAQPNLRHDEVNVAVVGNRFVDLPTDFTTEQKIDVMVQTFFAVARQKKCCSTLRICVHDSNVLDVDFAHYPTVLEHLAKRPTDVF